MCLPTMAAMMPKPPLPEVPAASPSTDEELCLMGASGLSDFIEFARARAVDGAMLDRGKLADLWRDAARVYKALEVSEAGAADKPEILPLPPLLQAHVNQLVKLAHFQSTFASVPVAFGMVELDKLIASQRHLTRSSIQAMTSGLSRPVSEADLAAVCLPLTPQAGGFRLALNDGEEFIFAADTHDARFLGAQVLKPSDVPGLKVSGHAQAIVALAVGYTTNVLNVVRYGSRLVLNNGYHRAFALRELGVTHAPCLIQVCGHWEDVGLAGAREIYENGTVYFSSARPPMLRDFGNPALTYAFATRRAHKQIRLSYEVDTVQFGL